MTDFGKERASAAVRAKSARRTGHLTPGLGWMRDPAAPVPHRSSRPHRVGSARPGTAADPTYLPTALRNGVEGSL